MIKSKNTDTRPAREKFKQEITLLSHGYSNPTAFPNGKITVYPWDSGVDEWLMKRSKKGRRETILFDLVARIANLNGAKVEDVVNGDVSTILMVSRAIAKENKIPYTATCPHCNATTSETISIPHELGKVGEKSETYPGFDSITLPVCQDEIKIRPLLVADELQLLEREAALKEAAPDRIAHILQGIVAINDTKPDSLQEFLTWWNSLHPKDQLFLEKTQNDNSPHLDTNIKHSCNACNKPFVYSLSIDDDFFSAAQSTT